MKERRGEFMLKDLNKTLLEQVKCLKDEKLKGKNKVASENDEYLGLKNHNQNILKQIKKCKDNNKSLTNRFE